MLETRLHNRYSGFWEYIRSPFGVTPDVVESTLRRSKIIRAFKSVFGREPTEEEILRIANAYLQNKSRFGKFLRDPLFVKELQEDINRVIPNPIKTDGKFYFQTVAGIMRFQQEKGLIPTGVLNEATVSELVNIRTGGKIEQMRKSMYGRSSLKKIVLITGGIILLYLVLRAGR